MWKELEKGFSHIESAHALWEDNVFDGDSAEPPPPSKEFRFVPVGLEWPNQEGL